MKLEIGKIVEIVNLRNGFETQGRRHQKSKQEYQWPHKKDMCPPNIFKKKEEIGRIVSNFLTIQQWP